MVSLKRVVPIASAWSLFTVLQPAGLGQNSLSVSAPETDNSVKAELASFAVDKQLQVNLFADESMGIANPVCMRWDARGRLWVLCTWAYPQLKPGVKPNDKLLILEDSNGDAKADEVFTYTDGLNMPTGFALGHGGAEERCSAACSNNPPRCNSRLPTRETLISGTPDPNFHQ